MKENAFFFLIGILFLFSAVAHFSKEFLFEISDVIKLISLILLTVSAFFLGNYLKGENK